MLNIDLSRIITKGKMPTELEWVKLISDALLAQDIHLAYSHDEQVFYQYSNKNKYWKEINNKELTSYIWKSYVSSLQHLLKSKKALLDISDQKELRKRETLLNNLERFKFKQIQEIVISFANLQTNMPTPTVARYIPLLNGYIDLKTLEFKPIDRKIYNRYVIPFKYKENTKEPTLFLKFLEQIQPKESHREFLINWLAYLLVPGNPRQKAIFFLGDGANGKGVLTRVITKILGETNITNLTVTQQNISQDTKGYMVATMKNTLVNIAPDNSEKEQIDTGFFKSAVACDPMLVRQIRGVPFRMQYFGKLVYATNRMPFFATKDYAIIRRVEILPFPVVIPEEKRIKNFEEKIFKDGGDAIFMFLLNRARELAKKDFMFDTPKTIVEYSFSLLNEKDNMLTFLEEEILQEQDERITYMKYSRQDLFNMYKEFCLKNGYKIPNRDTFKDGILTAAKKLPQWKIEYKKVGSMVFIFTRNTAEPVVVDMDDPDAAEKVF